MIETNYDNQKLKAYLLGELSGADVEAFDEASFTDEKFGAALSAAENDLIDAYLHKELRGADLKKFESVYLATKHRREKIEFARAVQTVAGNEILNSKTERAGFFAWWNIFGSRALQFGFAAAALLVLLTGIFWIAVLREKKAGEEIVMQKTPTPEMALPENQNAAPKNENSNQSIPSAIQDSANENLENTNEKPSVTNQKIPNANINKNSNETNRTTEKENPPKIENNPPRSIIATFFLAPPLRGVNKIPLFDVPKNASQINVELQLEARDYETYHVTLTNETGDINLWRRGSLKAKNKGDAKVLNVSFPAKLLNNGFYSLTVSGVSSGGEAEIVANYPFRVNGK